MKKKRYSKKQLHKKKCRAIMGFIMSLLLLCLASGVLVAKYYAGRSNKGVATASGLYFSSNVLKNVGNATEEATDSNYPIIYNTTAWNGTGACILDVQIRNYQNQLLYNDSNLDITYNICFELVAASDGGTYQVSYGNETKTITNDSNSAQFNNITLKGGKARADQFKISVTRPDNQADNSNYRSVGICVTATPVSPSYVTNTGTLGGILYATMVSAQYRLDYNFNKVTDGLDKFSGFPCTIIYMPGEDNSAHEIKIKWSPILEIDQFDSYYQQAVQESKVGTETIGGKEWKTITITIQPYSSIQIAFYRASGFSDTSVNLSECVRLEDMTIKKGSVTTNE